MRLECPACGTKIYSFDAEGGRGCPKCGHSFEEKELSEGAPLVPSWILWLALLLGPGVATLISTFVVHEKFDRPGSAAFGGGSLLFVFAVSVWIAARRETIGGKIGIFVLAIAGAVTINGVIFFAGCALSMGNGL